MNYLLDTHGALWAAEDEVCYDFSILSSLI